MNAFEILLNTIWLQSLFLLDNFLSFLPQFYLIHLGFGVISVYFIDVIFMTKSLLTLNTTMKIII